MPAEYAVLTDLDHRAFMVRHEVARALKLNTDPRPGDFRDKLTLEEVIVTRETNRDAWRILVLLPDGTYRLSRIHGYAMEGAVRDFGDGLQKAINELTAPREQGINA